MKKRIKKVENILSLFLHEELTEDKIKELSEILNNKNLKKRFSWNDETDDLQIEEYDEFEESDEDFQKRLQKETKEKLEQYKRLQDLLEYRKQQLADYDAKIEN